MAHRAAQVKGSPIGLLLALTQAVTVNVGVKPRVNSRPQTHAKVKSTEKITKPRIRQT
jgi:hypothetical protein